MPYRSDKNSLLVEKDKEILRQEKKISKLEKKLERRSFIERTKNRIGDWIDMWWPALFGGGLILLLFGIIGAGFYVDLTNGPGLEDCESYFSEAEIPCAEGTIQENKLDDGCSCVSNNKTIKINMY